MARNARATSCNSSASPAVKLFCQSVLLVMLIVIPPGIADLSRGARVAARFSGPRSKKKPTCQNNLWRWDSALLN
jgi:hypothetical protein